MKLLKFSTNDVVKLSFIKRTWFHKPSQYLQEERIRSKQT